MGTIGDLLGIDLAATLGQAAPEATPTQSAPELGTERTSSDSDRPQVEESATILAPSDATTVCQGAPSSCDAPVHPSEAADASSVPEVAAGALGQANPRHEAVLAAVLAETDLDPAQARRDLTLVGDLDVDDLALYAIVTPIERELRCSFADETVRSWQTLGDILDAVDAIGTARGATATAR